MAAARDPRQPKHSAPETPRFLVQAHERQRFIQPSERLVHDRALHADGVAPPGRCDGQYHVFGAPLDVDVADAGWPESVGRTEISAAQEYVEGCGAAARQAPRPFTEVVSHQCPGKFASHVRSHCVILPGMDASMKLLPGQVLNSSGQPRLDYRAVATLAFPFMLNSAVQAVLNATDTWFIGRLSPAATAAIGAVYWPILVCVLLFGGVGLSVQTSVAQAFGGRRYTRASQATWTALWAALFTLPVFVLLSLAGRWIFAPFHIPHETLGIALEYWFPRMLGGSLGIALWSLRGFFNGGGRPAITLWVTVSVAVANACLNQVFMFDLGLGVAGSGWATDVAQMIGVATAAVLFLSRATHPRYRVRLTTRLQGRA